MFGLDWWILLGCTILFNVIWPPITLAITLIWGMRSTKKTLSYAQSIERKVTKAIEDMEREAKQEDVIAGLLAEQEKGLKAMLDGFRGDIIKKTEAQISEAKAQVQAQVQAPTGQMSTLDKVLTIAANAIGPPQ